MTAYYATLDETQAELKAQDDTASELDKLRRYLRMVTKRIDSIVNPRGRRPYFHPYTEQRAFEINARSIDSGRNVFYMRDNLLSYSEVLVDGTDYTSSVENYPLLDRPINALHLNDDSKSWYDICSSSNSRQPFYIKVTGDWGYNADYANAWVDYDDLGANITASATTLTVGNADGDDPFGFSPRFSPGALIRINSEMMSVTAVNTTTDTLTVVRGVNGTTAAAHTAGDDVEVFQVEESIKRATIRQASAMYARRGKYQVQQLTEVGVMLYPTDLLNELRHILLEYQYG